MFVFHVAASFTTRHRVRHLTFPPSFHFPQGSWALKLPLSVPLFHSKWDPNLKRNIMLTWRRGETGCESVFWGNKSSRIVFSQTSIQSKFSCNQWRRLLMRKETSHLVSKPNTLMSHWLRPLQNSVNASGSRCTLQLPVCSVLFLTYEAVCLSWAGH